MPKNIPMPRTKDCFRPNKEIIETSAAIVAVNWGNHNPIKDSANEALARTLSKHLVSLFLIEYREESGVGCLSGYRTENTSSALRLMQLDPDSIPWAVIKKLARGETYEYWSTAFPYNN